MNNNNKAYILIKDVNDYSQHGSYFVAWFAEKPSKEQVVKALKCNDKEALRLIERGSDREYTGQWTIYKLIEVEEGFNFDDPLDD